MATARKRLTGRVAAEAVRRLEIPRLPSVLLAGFGEITDLTATVSDVMDAMGLVGAVPAAVLAPTLPDRRLVGQAVTVRNVERRQSVRPSATGKVNTMGDTEAYHLAEPGDVVVIEGLTGVSNMGGQGVAVARRAGCAGAIIDGSFRDPSASRELDFPIWARGPTPITGKWRLETVEINGRVRVASISVDAGDLVVADEAGVVFVPFDRAADVLEASRRIEAGDRRRQADIEAGVEIAELNRRTYK